MFDTNRSWLKIECDKTDQLIEALTLISFVFSFAFIGYYYSELPDRVPAHFGLDGEVKRYDEKSMIWLIPMLLSAICFGVYKLNKHPYLYNYTVKITPENAKNHYKDASKIIRYINFCIALMCAVITYEIVNIALKNTNSFSLFSNYFLILSISFLTLTPIVMVIKTIVKTTK